MSNNKTCFNTYSVMDKTYPSVCPEGSHYHPENEMSTRLGCLKDEYMTKIPNGSKERFVSLSGAVRRPFSRAYSDKNYQQPKFVGVN